MRFTGQNVLVVPPFDCAWLMGEEARFSEPGKVCVAFEAMTENDITVVFKEFAGSKHYRTDSGPSYTLILGSHRNRRFKIEVDGRTVVDIASVMLQPTHFEHFWINVSDGVFTVGKGDLGKGVVYQWVDSKPKFSVNHVGLSSWDKHVVYRNIQVLPPLQPSRKQTPCEMEGFARYVASEDLADLHFIVGPDERVVPAHMILLVVCCSKIPGICSSLGGVVPLPLVRYHILFALLQYIYTGHTQVYMNDIDDLGDLGDEFGCQMLVSQCEEMKNVWERASDAVSATQEPRVVDIQLRTFLGKSERQGVFLSQLPIDSDKLARLLESGSYTDVNLSLDEHSQVIRAHRLILSAWSKPFAKMFTNGMRESKMDDVLIREVGLDSVLAMIKFMYCGYLELDGRDDMGSILLRLLILADRFEIPLLQETCIEHITNCLTKDSACAVLEVAATMPVCQALCESCEEICARHFDFCTALPALEFAQLENSSLQRILQHSDLRVTSEEKVFDAVIIWAAKMEGIKSWRDVCTYLCNHEEESSLPDRLVEAGHLLQLVRFPLMSPTVLQELEASCLTRHVQVLKELVLEALEYLGQSSQSELLPAGDTSKKFRPVKFPKRFTPRTSAYKELQYVCDGDCNGVFYHIGTSYGMHSWMNPVMIKKLSVTASSPPSRFTDMKALVSRKYQCTSFAGPSLEDGGISSWWKVDLGENHQLMCNYYTVRQDNSTNFMRSWALQGSNDGEAWTELSSHENEQTVGRPGQYASWPVLGASAYLPFRFFRVVLTRPTTSTTMNPWNFCLCYLELYGYFQ